MSLIRKGSNYFIVYVQDGKQIWRTTGTDNKEIAQAVHDTLLHNVRQDRAKRTIARLLGEKEPEPSKHLTAKTKRRLKLSDMLKTVEKYRTYNVNQRCAFERFTATLPKSIQYCDQVTADIAFNYLQSSYGKQKSGAWNNNKSYLLSLFSAILIDASMPENPFARVIQRRTDDVKHQRPFTEDECRKIINHVPEPWKTAGMIAYYTGLRKPDVFSLLWSRIKDNIINAKPRKTANFGRAIQAPIHPALSKHLATIPRVNDYVLGFAPLNKHDYSNGFGEYLEALNIKASEQGIVKFDSFRNSFITRCRAAGIVEHAIRGIVGHTSSNITDLYSHDIQSAMQIQTLPPLDLFTE